MKNNEYIGEVNTAKLKTISMIFEKISTLLDQLQDEAMEKRDAAADGSPSYHFHNGATVAINSIELHMLAMDLDMQYQLCKEIGIFDNAEKEEIT